MESFRFEGDRVRCGVKIHGGIVPKHVNYHRVTNPHEHHIIKF